MRSRSTTVRGRSGPSGHWGAVVVTLVALLLSACTAEPDIPAWARATARPAAAPTDGSHQAAPASASTDALGADVRIVTFGVGEPVTFETDVGDLSWSISVTAPRAGDLVGIRRVVDPGGEPRYLADLRNEVLVVDELHPRVLADADALGLYVTSAVDQPLPVGTWTVDVVANAGQATVRVAIRSGDPASPQRLDIVGWVPAPVADLEQVAAAWRADMDAVLAPQAIAVGRLDLVPAGEGGRPFATLGVDGLANPVHEACDAAAQATGAPPRTALVVLTERIGEGVLTASTDDGGRVPSTGHAYRAPDGDIAGFAVATPGTPVTGPRSHACVAVSAGEDPAAQGLVALHEILHQAGITRHTTERSGQDFDRLEDTPECPRVPNDADGDFEVDRAECAALDGDNLMFWATGGVELSTEQAWRIRTHPLLQPAG